MWRICAVALSFVGLAECGDLSFQADSTGKYTVSVGDDIWFPSASPMVPNYSDGIKLVDVSASADGSHAELGPYVEQVQTWNVKESRVLHTLRQYKEHDAIEFITTYPDGMDNTGTGDIQAVCSAFTSFKVTNQGSKSPLALASFQGNMVMDSYTRFGLWNEDLTSKTLVGGPNGGLIMVYDNEAKKAVVISASSQFMSANFYLDDSTKTLYLGVMGDAQSIPKNFEMSFMIASGSGQGQNQAMLSWGGVLTRKFGKTTAQMESDETLLNLGYSTDNGAYYYYHVENSTGRWSGPEDFEQTQIDIKRYADSIGVKYNYILLDSWWYPHGPHGGVMTWTAIPDVFPNGLYNIWQKTGLSVQGHNRWWEDATPYAKQNGGDYEFIIDEYTHFSIPTEQRFWDDLMKNSSQWGLIVYEQDWLYNEYSSLNATLQSVSMARQWLLQMGEGALKSGITIQYCMPFPRHVLQSVEVPVVTNFRASADYNPGNTQWRLGMSSLLARSLHLAPSKDNYWSTAVQPGSDWPNNTEPNSELQSAVSSYTTGPVAPSDRIGYSNASLIMKCCMSDGRLLKPDVPATLLDDAFTFRGFGTGGANGEMTHSFSSIGQYMKHDIVLAAQLNGDYNVSSLYLSQQRGDDGSDERMWYMRPRDDKASSIKLQVLDSTHPLQLHSCGTVDFQVAHTSPVLNDKWVLLGELNKWVPVSKKRFISLSSSADTLSIELRGASGEIVEVSVAVLSKQIHLNRSLKAATSTISTFKCTLPASGSATLSLPAGTCGVADAES